MYKITFPDGTSATTEKPNFIRVHSNNCFVLCPRDNAEGVAHHGTAYLFEDGTHVHEVDGGDIMATWDALDAAYTEGVNSAYDE